MPAKKTTASSKTRKSPTPRKTTKKPEPKVKIALTPRAEELFSKVPKTGPETPEEPSTHIRNLRAVPLRLRFPSQKVKDGDQGFELKPRGERGDIVRVSDPDLESTYYQANLGLTFEAITASEAKEIISKQSVNEQTQVHPAMASLRNELGQPYEGDLQLEVPYEQQGKVIANVHVDERRPLSPVNIDRNPGAGPRVAQDVPGGIDPQREAQIQRDEVARRKDVQGPKAGLAGINKVTVEEVQRS